MSMIVILTLLFISECSSISYDISLTPDSLLNGKWTNGGTIGSTGDITSFPGGIIKATGDLNSLCFDQSGQVTYINYNTNSNINPKLTMEIWIKPTATPTGTDWLLGHDNGGYDRAIMVYDTRYNGIAMGVGYSYQSTVSYPEIYEWTHIIATFNAETNEATIYKNGGDANGGEEQTVDIGAVSGGEPNIGLNGLKNYGNHNFVGCIGQVQIVNDVISDKEIKLLYKNFKSTIASAKKTEKGSYEASYTCDSLTSSSWSNRGTLTGIDITGFTGDVDTNIDGLPGLCFDETDAITYINYNTNSYLNPQLTMEVWIYPKVTPTGTDWLLGHDNGGYDRAILVYDNRYNGIAAGVGYSYSSTVSYAKLHEWTQIIVTFDSITKKANIYKNGAKKEHESQTVDIGGVSGGESNIGLNGLKNYVGHTFGGCIGQIQITNRVVTDREITGLYRKFKKTVNKGCRNGADDDFDDDDFDEMMYNAGFAGFDYNMYDNKVMISMAILFSLIIIVCGLIVNRFYVKKKDVVNQVNDENSPLLINVQSKR